MTTTYTIRAWCVRPFIAWLHVEAGSPEEAIATARTRRDQFLDTAEECNPRYPWDEFAAQDEDGNELLHVLDDEARLRDAAPALLEALVYVRAILKLRHIDEAGDDEVEEAAAMADKAIAQAQPASPLPTL